MLYLLGTDEAGYGPNLGPLVVAATLWRVRDASLASPADLYEQLAAGITNDPADPVRLTIADSKQLYSSGDSLARLEQGVLAALASLERVPRTWPEMWSHCSPAHRCELPWHRTFDRPPPYALSLDAITAAARQFQGALEQGGVELVDVQATILHPSDFNDHCDRLDSKGAVLSSATLALARGLLGHCSDGPVQIVCDKHGGRNRYAGHVWEELAAHEPAASDGHSLHGGFPVQTVCEGRHESRYRWQGGTAGSQAREIRFVTKGERFLPAALASMFAKYLRELSMMAFNAFWAERVPNLKPTAGYPGDALRFWNDIEPVVRLARFEERQLWRAR
jgi:hypothetical protein